MTAVAMPSTDLAPLTRAEAIALGDCEQRIERGLKTFIEVGSALAAIRDNRLYRATHESFETYCRERWNLSRPRAYELMTAAEVVSAMADTEQPPTNERQARELAKVPEPERAEVWAEAVERTDGKPTAAVVRQVAAERAEPTSSMPAPKPAPVPTDEQRAQLPGAILAVLAEARPFGLTDTEVWTRLPMRSAHSSWVLPVLEELAEAGRVDPAGRARRGNTMEPLWVLAEPAETPAADELPAEPDPVALVAAALDRFVPDENAAVFAWRRDLHARLAPVHKLTLWIDADDAADFASADDVETIRQLALSFSDLHRRILAARNGNVVPLRAVQ